MTPTLARHTRVGRRSRCSTRHARHQPRGTLTDQRTDRAVSTGCARAWSRMGDYRSARNSTIAAVSSGAATAGRVISGHHGPSAARQRRDQLVGGSGALVVGTHHHERRHLDAADRLDRRGDSPPVGNTAHTSTGTSSGTTSCILVPSPKLIGRSGTRCAGINEASCRLSVKGAISASGL
jgi:hypothetical protein